MGSNSQGTAVEESGSVVVLDTCGEVADEHTVALRSNLSAKLQIAPYVFDTIVPKLSTKAVHKRVVRRRSLESPCNPVVPRRAPDIGPVSER